MESEELRTAASVPLAPRIHLTCVYTGKIYSSNKNWCFFLACLREMLLLIFNQGSFCLKLSFSGKYLLYSYERVLYVLKLVAMPKS